MSIWMFLGGIGGASAVAAGAYGAHGLTKHTSDKRLLKNWQTATNYHMVHSLALCAVPALLPSPYSVIAGSLFTAGIVGFSGSLYYGALHPDNPGLTSGVAPKGGTALILAWLVTAASILARR